MICYQLASDEIQIVAVLEDRGRMIPLLWDQIAPEDWAAPSSAWIAESSGLPSRIDGVTRLTLEKWRRTTGLTFALEPAVKLVCRNDSDSHLFRRRN
jgi:hypothetical protein